MISLLLATAPLLAAPGSCPGATTSSDLVREASSACEAFGALEGERFRAAEGRLMERLVCLGEAVAPDSAAQVHVVRGLAAFLDDNEAGTVSSFQAAQAADPSWELGDWLPATHPARLDWRFAERLAAPAPGPLAPAPGVTVLADGHPAMELVPGRPAVLQRQVDGQIQETLLWSGGALPDWAPLAAPRLAPEARRRLWLGAGTALTASATAALLTVASSAHARYTDLDTPYTDLAELEKRANSTSTAAILTGVATGGLGVGLILTW